MSMDATTKNPAAAEQRAAILSATDLTSAERAYLLADQGAR